MRVVLLGVTRVALESLRALIEAGAEVVGILTTPRAFTISYSSSPVVAVQHADLASAATALHVPVMNVTGPVQGCADAIRDWAPDLLFAAGWYYVIPPSVLALPRLGALGVHASLLPKYRGGAPVNWAIINGEEKTGVTLFYLDAGIDSGDIIAQAELPIEFEDTCATVYDKVVEKTRELIRRCIPLLEQSRAPRIPQDESAATWFPRRRPEDGEINWSRTTRQLYDWVRALTRPYPGAFTWLDGQPIHVWKSLMLPQPPRAKAGTVTAVDPGRAVDVATIDGTLRLLDLEGCSWERVVPGVRFSERSIPCAERC